MPTLDSSWAMIAVPFDTVDFIPYPVFCQPKLNGVRAKWDYKTKQFVSRQGKVWKESLLPHLYHQAKFLPPVSFDGELYCHRTAFQDICARVAVNANTAHKDVDLVQFHIFDVINDNPAKERLDYLKFIDDLFPTVKAVIIKDRTELLSQLNRAMFGGYEGLILRLPGAKYLPGISQALIKVKPVKQEVATIVDMTAGKGKCAGMLGALVVKNGAGVEFKVGGGLSDQLRKELYGSLVYYKGRRILISYTEKSKSGTPLKPQLLKLLP